MTLTEQWKNGELQGGWYFLEFENGAILPVYYCGFNREFEFGWDWKISKVLARCSYEEFDNITKCYLCAHEKADRLEKENKQLKELLKEYRKQLSDIKNAYIDLTTQDEYGSYYIDEAKLFIETVGKTIKDYDELELKQDEVLK